jgi:hypothetical protein
MYQLQNIPDFESGNGDVFSTAGTRTINFILNAASGQTLFYDFVDSATPAADYRFQHQPNLQSNFKIWRNKITEQERLYTATTIGVTNTVVTVTPVFLGGAAGVLRQDIDIIALESSGIEAFTANIQASFVKSTGGVISAIGTPLINIQTNASLTTTIAAVSPNVNVTLTSTDLSTFNWYIKANSFFTNTF